MMHVCARRHLQTLFFQAPETFALARSSSSALAAAARLYCRAMSSGVLPEPATADTSQPASARSDTTSTLPLSAAPCSAVHPDKLSALASAPAARSRRTSSRSAASAARIRAVSPCASRESTESPAGTSAATMSLSVSVAGRQATPSSAMSAAARTSRSPIGTAPPSKASSALRRAAASARPIPSSEERSASRHSAAGTRASQLVMYRWPAAEGRVAALTCACAQSRTSTASRLWTGDSPSSHACTMSTEKPLQPPRGGPKIIDGQRLTISPPRRRVSSQARRSDSAFENWYGSKFGPSRRLTVFQSAAE
mmetsp:Transcript_28751/g.92453  ORF Transcript_28751/g.92453 Transcript_28751/m.92453 type:complete len:310 (+) Transcript_28751:16-945(+)